MAVALSNRHVNRSDHLVTSIPAWPQRIEKFKKILKTLRLQNEDCEEEEMLSTEGIVITQDLLSILDCKTRWNSGYFFVKRSLKLRVAIDEIAKDKDLRKYELNQEDWRILQQVLEFLEEFASLPILLKEAVTPLYR